MDWIALVKTIGLCLVSIVIEAFSATREGKKWFENLRQPECSFPFSFWYMVGGLYYILCGIIAYRQFHVLNGFVSLPVTLLMLMMIANGLTNFILFRFRSLRMFYLVLYPFAALFVLLGIFLFSHDVLSASLAGIYLVWLVYDLYYFRSLWRLNIGQTG